MKIKHLFFSLVTLIGPVCGLSSSAEPVESNNHQSCKTGRHFFNDHALVSSSYKTTKAPNFGTCYAHCMGDKECCSINYKKTTKICQRNNITKTQRPGNFRSQMQTIYAEVRGTPEEEVMITPSPNQDNAMRPQETTNAPPPPNQQSGAGSSSNQQSGAGSSSNQQSGAGSSSNQQSGHGSSQVSASHKSCEQILNSKPGSPSGIYQIKIDPENTFEVFCDMVTGGGGWTLVYSYSFTNPSHFTHSSNAVTPIPTWPVSSSLTMTPTSTTVPLNETANSAMEFSLWKKIGRKFLVKSNITHWISCSPRKGSLVDMNPGEISCEVVKNVTTDCLGYAPTVFGKGDCGPYLERNSTSIAFFGCTKEKYPVHHPCGQSGASNHMTNITSPSGSLFIR